MTGGNMSGPDERDNVVMVDMNRLRVSAEFAGSFVDSSHEAIAEILNAVIAAPIVYHCDVSGADTVLPACGHAPDQTDCGWVALVRIAR